MTRQNQSPRVAAVDVFRALTMFLMLFVNDIPGLKEIPHWLLHAEMKEDMLGFSDTIFPAFLFCMGMAVPLAIENRYRKGDTTLQVMGHVLTRTVALVAMGLFTLNCGGVEGGLSYGWFSLLMVLAFFLMWAVYPKAEGAKKRLFIVMKAVGVLLLALLVVQKDVCGRPFHIGWWGILGLIGWTYAVCSLLYIYTRSNLRKALWVWAAVLLLCVLNSSSLIPADYASRIVILPFIPGGWTHHALGMSGIVCTVLMQRYGDKARPRRLLTTLWVLGVDMLLLGLLSHQVWIISKIMATPTWLFYCLAIFFPLFGCIYWLTDVKGKAGWFRPIRPAGTATLTCYIIPYAWYALVSMWHIHYPEVLGAGVPGLLKSLVFAFLVVQLTGLLAKGGVRLKV